MTNAVRHSARLAAGSQEEVAFLTEPVQECFATAPPLWVARLSQSQYVAAFNMYELAARVAQQQTARETAIQAAAINN